MNVLAIACIIVTAYAVFMPLTVWALNAAGMIPADADADADAMPRYPYWPDAIAESESYDAYADESYAIGEDGR